jgi:hypothetical protein
MPNEPRLSSPTPCKFHLSGNNVDFYDLTNNYFVFHRSRPSKWLLAEIIIAEKSENSIIPCYLACLRTTQVE